MSDVPDPRDEMPDEPPVTPTPPTPDEHGPAGRAATAAQGVRDVIDDVAAAREDLGAFIRRQRDEADLTLRKLSKLAGVSNPYLSQIERGLRNPSAEILQAIAKALNLSAETLYVRAGILEERTDSDVESAIARDPSLTEHQRATLIEMYRTFRSVSGLDRRSTVQRITTSPADGGDAPAAAEDVAGADDERGVVERVIDRVTTGDVTDADIAATTVEGEDPAEA